MVTPYRPNEQGELVPEVPDEGVCRGWDERPCRIRHHHRRERATGPCFPLIVVRCSTHGRAFTLYPPGHVPYGRRAVAPVASDGSTVRPCAAQPESAKRDDGIQPLPETVRGFKGTLFGAALDAAQGIAWKHRWQREVSEVATECGRTQHRLLDVAMRLVGVAPVITAALRERMAEVLSVPLLLLAELARHLVTTRNYWAKGEAIAEVLAALPCGACLVDRLVEAGHLVGLWPAPLRWDPKRRILLRRAFRPPRTRGPPGSG